MRALTVKHAQIYLTTLLFFLGMLGVIQLRSQEQSLIAKLARSTDQAGLISNIIDSNIALRQEVVSLTQQVSRYESSPREDKLEALVADLNSIKSLNGLAEVAGPGVELIVGGRARVMDIQDLVNELRNAGAEAIEINGNRLVAGSVIVNTAEQGIQVEGHKLDLPYTFKAIGDPDALERALVRKGGLVQLLRFRYPETEIRVEKKSRLLLSIYSGGYGFRYASPGK